MANPLPCGFKLNEGNFGDSDEVWQLFQDALEEDAIWQVVFKNCKTEDIHSWLMSVLAPRWKLPDITFYMITEESSGYGRFHYNKRMGS